MITETEKDSIANIVKQTGLKHIAIIMDGNRRWAKSNNLPSAIGHKKGVESLKTILKSCHKFGIKYLTVYAFSTENWNRKPEEVNFLMDLLANTIKKEINELIYPKLPLTYSEEGKYRKVQYLLTRLRKKGIIINMGSDTKPIWKLK